MHFHCDYPVQFNAGRRLGAYVRPRGTGPHRTPNPASSSSFPLAVPGKQICLFHHGANARTAERMQSDDRRIADVAQQQANREAENSRQV